MRQKRRATSTLLATRLSRRMLRIYLRVYMLLLVVMTLALLPAFYALGVSQATSAARQIYTDFDGMQREAIACLDCLVGFPELSALFEQYHAQPTAATKSKLELYLQTYVSTFTNALYISIQDESGEVFRSIRYRDSAVPQRLMESAEYRALHEMSTGTLFFDFNGSQLNDAASEDGPLRSIAVAKNFRIGRHVYTGMLFFKVDAYLDSIHRIAGENFSDCCVLEEGRTYYTTNAERSDMLLQALDLLSLPLSGKTVRLDGLYAYNRIFASEQMVIAYASWFDLLENFIWIMALVTILYLLSPLLYAYYLKPAVNDALSPLHRLSDAMSAYSAGALTDLHIHTGDELELLSDAFEDMARKLAAQIESIRCIERSRAIVQYRLLTTQIDPHFIYNTMNIINVLARRKDTKAVVEVNSNLIHILQQRINTKTSVCETIENEIITLKRYQLIMDYRYASDVYLRYEIEDALRPTLMLKNILQPLIENAYTHGLTNEDGSIHGQIALSIQADGPNVVVTVTDSGRGMSEDRLQQVTQDEYDTDERARMHIGLSNIRQRLEYIYQSAYSFEIKSSPGHGTQVRIRFPICRERAAFESIVNMTEASG